MESRGASPSVPKPKPLDGYTTGTIGFKLAELKTYFTNIGQGHLLDPLRGRPAIISPGKRTSLISEPVEPVREEEPEGGWSVEDADAAELSWGASVKRFKREMREYVQYSAHYEKGLERMLKAQKEAQMFDTEHATAVGSLVYWFPANRCEQVQADPRYVAIPTLYTALNVLDVLYLQLGKSGMFLLFFLDPEDSERAPPLQNTSETPILDPITLHHSIPSYSIRRSAFGDLWELI